MDNYEEPKIIDAEFEEIIKDKVDTIVDSVVEEMQAPTTFDIPTSDIIPKEKLNRKQRRTQSSVGRRVVSRTRAAKKIVHNRMQAEIQRKAVQAKHDRSHARAIARKELNKTQ